MESSRVGIVAYCADRPLSTCLLTTIIQSIRETVSHLSSTVEKFDNHASYKAASSRVDCDVFLSYTSTSPQQTQFRPFHINTTIISPVIFWIQ